MPEDFRATKKAADGSRTRLSGLGSQRTTDVLQPHNGIFYAERRNFSITICILMRYRSVVQSVRFSPGHRAER